MQHHTEKAVWIEFWVMWRRIAGGLTEAQQRKLYDYLKPHLARRVPPDAPQAARASSRASSPRGWTRWCAPPPRWSTWTPGDKAELGQWIAARLKAETRCGGPWAWALGRLGARVPLYGSSHKVVDVEVAEAWLALLLELDLSAGRRRALRGGPARAAHRRPDAGPGPELRARRPRRSRAAKAPDTWVRMVTEVVALEAADEARALGDTLPAGLRL